MVNRKEFAIFDFDGVIFDSKDIAIRNVELLRRQPEFEHLPSPARIGNFSEIFCGTLRTSLLRFGLTPEESQRFFDSHANLMSEQRELMGLFTGVSEFLRCIPSDSWAIVTSAYEEVVYDILEREGVHTADLIVIGHSIKKSKSAKITDLLFARGIEVSDVLYIGDMQSDVEYCKEIGIDFVGVDYGYHPRHILNDPNVCAVYSTPADLFAAVFKLLNITQVDC